MSVSYNVSSDEVAALFDERSLLDELARTLAENLANDLDPDGSNPNLADEIKDALDSDPSFYENMSEAIFDGDEASAEQANNSLLEAVASVTGDVVPAAIEDKISDITKAMQAASKAANDNIPQSFRDAFDNATDASKKIEGI